MTTYPNLSHEMNAALILDLERREESLIEQALDQGQVIRRRADADPRAILGICDPAEPTREAA